MTKQHNHDFVALMKFSNGVKIASWEPTEEIALREINRRKSEPLQYGHEVAALIDARVAHGEAALSYADRTYGNVFERHSFA